MPLLDHFHPPISPLNPWESFHTHWATRLAEQIAPLLPPEFQVEVGCHGGRVEIDVATFERQMEHGNGFQHGQGGVLTWSPPAAAYTLPAIFPDTFEVRVFSTIAGLTLAAAIELVSPGNKDRPDTRRAFATKCASYLHQGVALIIVDIVTNRRANLHNEVMRLMNVGHEMPDDGSQYTVAYRPVLRDERPEIDVWPATVKIGEPLPTLPLRLTGDTFIPVEFEAAYHEVCVRKNLA